MVTDGLEMVCNGQGRLGLRWCYCMTAPIVYSMGGEVTVGVQCERSEAEAPCPTP